MSSNSKFSLAENDLIHSLTGLSTGKSLLRHICKVLSKRFLQKLKTRPVAEEMLETVRNSLGERDATRLCTILALTAEGAKSSSQAAATLDTRLRRSEEFIDLKYKWLSRRPALRQKLEEALSYKSRRAFISLCRKHGVHGSRAKDGGSKSYSPEDVLKLLRGKLATLPWWEARLIAALIAGRHVRQNRKAALAEYLSPPRPAEAFKPRVRRHKRVRR